MRAILSKGLRYFATSSTAGAAATKPISKPRSNNLPKYYANVCLDKGLEYYDYENYQLSFGFVFAFLIVNKHLHNRNQDDYEIIRKLGSGKYSGVFEGVNILDHKRVTIKILKKGTSSSFLRAV